MILNILSFSSPLILASLGALFSELAGSMALFLDGLITFSAFLTYLFTNLTGSAFLGSLISISISTSMPLLFAYLAEKFNGNKIILGIATNLLFGAMTSCLSLVIFGTRGVLSSTDFAFSPLPVQVWTLTLSALILCLSLIFLMKTRPGLYLRLCGSDSDVLLAKGVNPPAIRIFSWGAAGFYSALSGSFLTFRISSFVPNISSGRGWLALAAVFAGRKKPLKIIISVVIFCMADFFAANIQNYLPQIPTSVLISFPYLIIFLLVFAK